MLWMLTLLASLAFAQDTVQDVYTVLSKQYEASLLERAAIEGMLDIVDQQAGLNGSTVLSHAEFTDGKPGKKGSVTVLVYEFRWLLVVGSLLSMS